MYCYNFNELKSKEELIAEIIAGFLFIGIIIFDVLIWNFVIFSLINFK